VSPIWLQGSGAKLSYNKLKAGQAQSSLLTFSHAQDTVTELATKLGVQIKQD
jgi:hypothetical protein